MCEDTPLYQPFPHQVRHQAPPAHLSPPATPLYPPVPQLTNILEEEERQSSRTSQEKEQVEEATKEEGETKEAVKETQNDDQNIIESEVPILDNNENNETTDESELITTKRKVSRT